MPQQTVCPSCAEPLDPEDVFCGSCGASRHEPPAAMGTMPAGWVADRPAAAGPPAAPRGPVRSPGLACVRCGAEQIAGDGYCEACGQAQPRPRDHMEKALAGVAGVSDRGVRHHRNEDSFTVAATSLPGGRPAVVAVVCDGVSSSDRPDEASETAVDSASEALLTALEQGQDPTLAMRGAIAEAARAVAALAADGHSPARPDVNAPACTYVSAIATAGRVTIGWVGDTRAYWIPDDRDCAEPFRLTQDDSWAARMVEAGLMEEAEAYADPRAHAITGWLGADAEEVIPHTLDFTPHVPGVLLICTDGLWNYAEAATDLAYRVRTDARTEPLAAAQELVRFAVAAGGHDNITVAVLPIVPATDLAGTAEPAATQRAEAVTPHDDTLPDLPVIGSPRAPLPPATPVPSAPAVPAVPAAAPAATQRAEAVTPHDDTLPDLPVIGSPRAPLPPAPPQPPTVPAPPDHPPAPAPRD